MSFLIHHLPFTVHHSHSHSPFVIDHSQFSIFNSPLSARAGCAKGAPVVSGARNAMSALDLSRVRRFFARFKKPVVFKDQIRWTAGYQPATRREARTSLRKPARSKGETLKRRSKTDMCGLLQRSVEEPGRYRSRF
jgi:hypothetical protein